jgi:thymidylate synthase ThyX
MRAETGANSVHSSPLRVRLVAWTHDPLSLAIASARSCYSTKIVFPEDVTDDQKRRLSKELLTSGHLTPFQHPTFVFALQNVSRHLVWSLLHSHPFYNSEQSSQRYNVLRAPDVCIPPFRTEKSRKRFVDAVGESWSAYGEIMRLFYPSTLERASSIGKIKRLEQKAIQREAERKAAETARYVLPVAAHTQLYHTVNGITLSRYTRWADHCDTPFEAKLLVEAMRLAIEEHDPGFADVIFRREKGASKPKSQSMRDSDGDKFAREFDATLDGKVSKLIAYTPKGESEVEEWFREINGFSFSKEKDMGEHLERAMNYEYPSFRSLLHVNYTFRKCISHSADSQEQRHREIDASRPLLYRTHTSKPDAVVPFDILSTPEARKAFEEVMKTLWEAKETLIDAGEDPRDACYILPNATKVRYTESGNYLAMRTKWRLRTCFLAQREIYDASMQELEQVREVHPRLADYAAPNCVLNARKGISGERIEGPCPEGPRWCGVKVWLKFPNVKRIF